MAEPKIRPLTEDELLYAVPPNAQKKAEAKVVPFTLSTANAPEATKPNPTPLSDAIPKSLNSASNTTSFFKENRTLLIVLGTLTLLAVGYYFYQRYQKEKKNE